VARCLNRWKNNKNIVKWLEILNNDFKKAYKNYLENQFKSSFLLKNISKLLERVPKSAIILIELAH
jgi:predicted GTPase